MRIETVKIQHPEISGKFLIINKSEFNPEIHKLFSEISEQNCENGFCGLSSSQSGDVPAIKANRGSGRKIKKGDEPISDIFAKPIDDL